jgi:hypothetical protein
MTFPIYRLIDISPDLAVAAQHVAAVRKIDDGSCEVFLVGQSAVDGGFKVDEPWDRIISDVNDELLRAAEEAMDLADDKDDTHDSNDSNDTDDDDGLPDDPNQAQQ